MCRIVFGLVRVLKHTLHTRTHTQMCARRVDNITSRNEETIFTRRRRTQRQNRMSGPGMPGVRLYAVYPRPVATWRRSPLPSFTQPLPGPPDLIRVRFGPVIKRSRAVAAAVRLSLTNIFFSFFFSPFPSSLRGQMRCAYVCVYERARATSADNDGME